MSRAFFDSGLPADVQAKLESIADDVDGLVTRKVGKSAVWKCTPEGSVRLLRASDSSVLFDISCSEFATVSEQALLAKLGESLEPDPSATADDQPPVAPSGLNYSGVFLYVDGSDLDDIAVQLEHDLEAFLAESGIKARVVNDRFERTPDLGPDDLPDWNLGLNLDRTETLEADLRRALEAIGVLATKHGREFVVGYYDADTDISEDILFISKAGAGVSTWREVCTFLGMDHSR